MRLRKDTRDGPLLRPRLGLQLGRSRETAERVKLYFTETSSEILQLGRSRETAESGRRLSGNRDAGITSIRPQS